MVRLIPRPHLLSCYLLSLIALAWLVHVVNAPPVRVFLEGPRYQYEPAEIRVRIRVEPHPDNRLLMVVAVADGFQVRRSDEQLEGEQSPRTRWVNWTDIPAGDYAVVAAVARTDGTAAQDRTTVSVIGRGF